MSKATRGEQGEKLVALELEKIKEYHLKGKVIMTCNPMKCHLYNDFIKAQNE
jgi:hypothetical protein